MQPLIPAEHPSSNFRDRGSAYRGHRSRSLGLLATGLVNLSLLLGAPSTLAAENLVFNGEFDTDVGGWVLFPNLAETVEPDPLDVDGSPTSGSAKVIASNAAGGEGYLWQCVPNLSSRDTYEAGVSVHMPFPQSAEGEAYLRIRWYSGNCNGFLSEIDGPLVPNLPFPILWIPSSISELTPPPETHSAHVLLVFDKIETGGFSTFYFDGAYLRPLPLFADGFESGDTANWD